MKELYFISVLSNLGSFFCILAIVSSFILLIAVLAYFGYIGDIDEVKNKIVSVIKPVAIVTILCALLSVFIPSKKDLYTICGLGPTIDYIKKDDVAKKLPEKAIKALDLYLDNASKN